MDALKNFQLPFSAKILQMGFYALATLAAAGVFLQSFQDGIIDHGIVRHEMGGIAWILLLFTLFISLFQKLFPKIRLFGQLLFLRKHTGITAFLFALSHTVFHFLSVGFSMDMVIFTFSDISLSVGAVALFILLVLTLTSTAFAMKTMGPKKWKMLQRFAHVAFWLVGIHVFFITGKDPEIFAPFVVYLLGYGYLWGKKFLKS